MRPLGDFLVELGLDAADAALEFFDFPVLGVVDFLEALDFVVLLAGLILELVEEILALSFPAALALVGELEGELVHLAFLGGFDGGHAGDELLDFGAEVAILGLVGPVFLNEEFYPPEGVFIFFRNVLAHHGLLAVLFELGLSRIPSTVCFFRKSRSFRFSTSWLDFSISC